MTKNNKGRSSGNRPTPKTTDSRNTTAIDPLIGLYSLGVPEGPYPGFVTGEKGGGDEWGPATHPRSPAIH
jgi:hypothetical protein